MHHEELILKHKLGILKRFPRWISNYTAVMACFCWMLKPCDCPSCLRVQGVDLGFLRGSMKSVCVQMESSTCQWPARAPLARNTAESASEAPQKATHPLGHLGFVLLLKSITESIFFSILETKYLQFRKQICIYSSGIQGVRGKRAQMTFPLPKNDLNQITCFVSNIWKTALQKVSKIKQICFLAELLFSQMIMLLFIFLRFVGFSSHYM